MSHGVLYADPTNKPLSPLTSLVQPQPNSYYLFYLTGSTFPVTVYSVGDLSVAYPTNKVTADSTGAFAGIFLDPTKVYRVQWFDQYNRKLMDVDPYISSLTTFGTVQLAFNIITGNVSITPTTPGGAGAALTVTAKPGGVAINTGAVGSLPGQAEIQILNTRVNGTSVPTFSGDTKPGGVSGGGIAQWMPINIDGFLCHMPLWS